MVVLLALVVCLGPTDRTRAADEAGDQAVWLLRKATLVHRNGFHNVLLRALRQMQDPRLEPLFSELVQRRHPGLKIHGILGLGEIADPPRLDLSLVAGIEAPGTQAQLISAAIDSDLLRLEEARQLAGWPGLDPAVRVLVLGKLVAEREPIDATTLREAIASDNLALSHMARLLKLQMTEAADPVALFSDLDGSDKANRDRVRGLILQTAIKHDFEKIGPWAGHLVRSEVADESLARQALRAALKFDAPRAVNAWLHRYDTAERLVERLRLGLLALDVAEHSHPRLFEPMRHADDRVLRLIGRVGTSLASEAPDPEAINALIDENNLRASRWALRWAMDQAEAAPARALPVLWHLIEAGRSEEARFRAERLEHVVIATQTIHEKIPAAHGPLADRLAAMPTFVQEAMLMGLIRSRGEHPQKVLAEIDALKSRTAESMALLIEAKHGDRLSAGQQADLSLIVRGGAGLQEPLRIQAAWTYLKLTRQDRVALATVLGGR